MPTIYLVDYIGVHSGMDYYLEAFKTVISGAGGLKVEILSNYSVSPVQKPFFLNQYKGKFWNKGFALLRNLFRLRKFVMAHEDDIFVYLTYGNAIDLHFMRIIAKAPNHIIDIHEGIAQNIDDNQKILKYFTDIYGSKIKNVISHSGRTDEFLSNIGFKGQKFKVPHFKYVFQKNYDRKNISNDLLTCIDPTRINLLFFGNLNKSKGVDIFIEAFNRLKNDVSDRFNVIIAGKDFDGSVWEVKPDKDKRVHIFARHINDDELRYLYQSVDYLCLPYRKTSQSGILEMAFYFKTPIIATNLDYFEKTLKEFPSFGLLAGTTVDEYSSALKDIASGKESNTYFRDEDYARYENRKEVEEFKKEIELWLKNH